MGRELGFGAGRAGSVGRKRKTRRLRAAAEVLEPRQLLTVVAHYFNNLDWRGPAAAVQQPYDVNFNWGFNSPDPAVRNDGFSSAFTGGVFAPATGNYTFVSATDDEGFLFVNGNLVSQDPGSHTLRPAPSHTSVFLTGGTYYDFVFYQRDRGGLAGAVLNWVTPLSGGVSQPIPGYDLSPYSGYDQTPGSPAGLTVTTITSLAVTLQWTGDTHATTYQIERSSDGVNFAPLAGSGLVYATGDGTTGVPTHYTDGSVQPGQTYYYRVSASNFDTQSGPSTTASAVTPPMAAATGVEAHYFNDPLWAGSPQWGTVAPNINMALASGVAPAPPIQSHDYSSLFTGRLTVSTPGLYTLLSNTDDDGYLYVDGALVSLDPGTHAARNAANFTPVSLGAGPHDVVFEESQGLSASAANMLYSGPDTGGSLVIVPTSVFSPLSDVPAAPTGLSVAAATSDSVTLQWQDNSVSETGYVIERSTDGINFTTAGTTGVVANPAPGVSGTASYVDAVDPGVSYEYRVRAVNFDGRSVSGSVGVTTPARTVTDIDYSSGFIPGTGLMLDGYKSFDSPHPTFFSPPAITADGRLRLTDDQLGESRAAFTTVRVPVDVFSTSFVYRAGFDVLPPDSPTTLFADGITFTIQNYNPGQQGVGYSVSGGVGGQGLAYAGTPRSVSVKLDIFQGPGDPSSSSTGVYTAGSTPAGGANLFNWGINLHGGNPIAVSITYRRDYQQLVTTLTDTVTHATFTGYNYLDIPTLVGGDWAYVGFTGASGGGHATQEVLNWNYSGRLGPPDLEIQSVYAAYGFTPGALTATLSYNGPLPGQVVDFNLNGVDLGTAVTDSTGTATLYDPALENLDVGYYGLSVSTPGDNLYASALNYGYVYVYQQYAQMQYTGLTLVTANSSGDATFQLQAVLSDTSGGNGDIRNGQVYFEIFASDGSWWYVPGGPVSLVDPSSDKTGVSTATWTTNLNGSKSATYQVYASVGNDYYGYGYATLTAAAPSVGQAGGAGAVTVNQSAGLYAADSGSLLNFNLTARNLSGDAKGTLTITYVRTDANGRKHTYQVQSTAITSYGSDPVAGVADIAATANLSDVTDPLHPILVAGGLQLAVTLSDRGNPGSNDSVGFTLWGNGLLYFSNDWSGTGTSEDMLRNGNLTVH